MPDEDIRNYYGEKITLYFKFLGYYARQHLWIGMAGLILFIIGLAFEDTSQIYTMLTMVFGFLQIQWTSSISEIWKQEESEFIAKFGEN